MGIALPGSMKMRVLYGTIVVGTAVTLVAIQPPGEDATGEEAAAAEANFHAPVVDLEDLVVSLADGAYLKLGLSLQLKPSEGDREEVDAYLTTVAQDVTLKTLAPYTKAELLRPDIRAKAKAELVRQLRTIHDGEVASIYITGFALQ